MNIEIHARLKQSGKKSVPVKILIKRRQLLSIVEQILDKRLKNMMFPTTEVCCTEKKSGTKKGYKERNKACIPKEITV